MKTRSLRERLKNMFGENFRKKLSKNAGLTLIETVVAIVVLGVIVGPVGGALVTSRKVNAYAAKVNQARLAVSSVAEAMMADGVDPDPEKLDSTLHTYKDEALGVFGDLSNPDDDLVVITAKTVDTTVDTTIANPNDLYDVTITSTLVPTVSVTTQIRNKEVGRP